ncbi:DUF92 domain-containing protein [Mucilaginibacter sp. McL0603]|uniref:DUF92 domain-containing protein n=1 Tax=Mucilaginibacter sp. McL0603 TaxID=3415670 RepID=UPI003CEF4337
MTVYYYLLLFLLLSAIIIISVKTGKLTLIGAIIGGVVAIMIFSGAGYTGLSMLAAFFVLGTIATSWKKDEKQQAKSIKDQSVKRNSGQVIANGGVAAIMGMLVFFLPEKTELLRLMMAASLASAMADTLSSELGIIYGRRFFNIITLRIEERGLDGVISIEGTVIGIIGSAVIALIYAIGFGWDIRVLFIIIAGTLGNLSDSVLGALLERKHYLNNNAVNFLNTLIAALAGGICLMLFG